MYRATRGLWTAPQTSRGPRRRRQRPRPLVARRLRAASSAPRSRRAPRRRRRPTPSSGPPVRRRQDPWARGRPRGDRRTRGRSRRTRAPGALARRVARGEVRDQRRAGEIHREVKISLAARSRLRQFPHDAGRRIDEGRVDEAIAVSRHVDADVAKVAVRADHRRDERELGRGSGRADGQPHANRPGRRAFRRGRKRRETAQRGRRRRRVEVLPKGVRDDAQRLRLEAKRRVVRGERHAQSGGARELLVPRPTIPVEDDEPRDRAHLQEPVYRSRGGHTL